MTTYLLMGLLVLGIAFSVLWKLEYSPDKNTFMSVEDTTFLRGFWCIVVVLVHVPATYQNRIQDMLGSFAYIGVTFFFITSSYGLKWSIEHKPQYLNCFWRKRLPPILIPALIANALKVLIDIFNEETFRVVTFINIDGWVRVLLLYYFIFWFVYKIAPKMLGGGEWQDIVICLVVLGCSLIDYFTKFKITSRWIIEPLGFAYGIIVTKYVDNIKHWIVTRWLFKSIVLLATAGLVGIAYLKFKSVIFWGDYVLKIILQITIIIFIFTVIGKIKVGNKLNEFLGSISYEVYLLHQVAFALVASINESIMNSGIFIVVSLLITIIAAYFLNVLGKFIDKMLIEIGGQVNERE